MPSGSYVIAHPYTSDYYTRDGTYLNINVYLLRVDAYHTTGLCGNYNLNSSDDGPASGNMHYCTATCETHRQEHFLLLIISNELFSADLSHWLC